MDVALHNLVAFSNEKNLDKLFDIFSPTLKNQLKMYFPETTSQPVERHAFGTCKSRVVKYCIKKRQKLFAKLLNNQNETNWQQHPKQRKLCTRNIRHAKHVNE